MSFQNINVAGYNGTINNLTVNGTLTTNGLSTQGTLKTSTASRSAAAWGTTGPLLQIDPCTLNDSTSSGSVSGETATSSFGKPTITATTATTYNVVSTLYIDGPPIAGTHVNITYPFSLWVNGAANFGSIQTGNITSIGGLTIYDVAVTYALSFGNQLTANVTTTALASYTQGYYDYCILCTYNGAVAVTLMTSPPTGATIKVKSASGTTTITITPHSGNIDGSSTKSLTAYQSADLIYDGTNWWSI